eukprot:snap_masked-scaffold_3-processed-gene-21.15-mRNA-1 protein AED:1.00 eAED:1.00 QI:0/-1/0/0/-1/1/1/0/1146
MLLTVNGGKKNIRLLLTKNETCKVHIEQSIGLSKKRKLYFNKSTRFFSSNVTKPESHLDDLRSKHTGVVNELEELSSILNKTSDEITYNQNYKTYDLHFTDILGRTSSKTGYSSLNDARTQLDELKASLLPQRKTTTTSNPLTDENTAILQAKSIWTEKNISTKKDRLSSFLTAKMFLSSDAQKRQYEKFLQDIWRYNTNITNYNKQHAQDYFLKSALKVIPLEHQVVFMPALIEFLEFKHPLAAWFRSLGSCPVLLDDYEYEELLNKERERRKKPELSSQEVTERHEAFLGRKIEMLKTSFIKFALRWGSLVKGKHFSDSFLEAKEVIDNDYSFVANSLDTKKWDFDQVCFEDKHDRSSMQEILSSSTSRGLSGYLGAIVPNLLELQNTFNVNNFFEDAEYPKSLQTEQEFQSSLFVFSSTATEIVEDVVDGPLIEKIVLNSALSLSSSTPSSALVQSLAHFLPEEASFNLPFLEEILEYSKKLNQLLNLAACDLSLSSSFSYLSENSGENSIFYNENIEQAAAHDAKKSKRKTRNFVLSGQGLPEVSFKTRDDDSLAVCSFKSLNGVDLFAADLAFRSYYTKDVIGGNGTFYDIKNSLHSLHSSFSETYFPDFVHMHQMIRPENENSLAELYNVLAESLTEDQVQQLVLELKRFWNCKPSRKKMKAFKDLYLSTRDLMASESLFQQTWPLLIQNITSFSAEALLQIAEVDFIEDPSIEEEIERVSHEQVEERVRGSHDLRRFKFSISPCKLVRKSLLKSADKESKPGHRMVALDGLPLGLSPEVLESIFSVYGEVESVEVFEDRWFNEEDREILKALDAEHAAKFQHIAKPRRIFKGVSNTEKRILIVVQGLKTLKARIQRMNGETLADVQSILDEYEVLKNKEQSEEFHAVFLEQFFQLRIKMLRHLENIEQGKATKWQPLQDDASSCAENAQELSKFSQMKYFNEIYSRYQGKLSTFGLVRDKPKDFRDLHESASAKELLEDMFKNQTSKAGYGFIHFKSKKPVEKLLTTLNLSFGVVFQLESRETAEIFRKSFSLPKEKKDPMNIEVVKPTLIPGTEKKTLHIENVPKGLKNEEAAYFLSDLIVSAGNYTRKRQVKIRRGNLGLCDGRIILECQSHSQARAVMKRLRGKEILGNKIKVGWM